MDDGIVYRELVGLRSVTWGLGIASAASMAVAAGDQHVAGGWLVLASIFGFFLVYFLSGIYRMNRIVLTRRSLLVGAERYQPEDFDLLFGVQPSLVLTPEEQHRVECDTPLPPNHEVHIAGGGWGRRIGTTMLVLRTADQRRLIAVFTRDPVTLDRLLTEWLERVPDPSEVPTVDER